MYQENFTFDMQYTFPRVRSSIMSISWVIEENGSSKMYVERSCIKLRNSVVWSNIKAISINTLRKATRQCIYENIDMSIFPVGTSSELCVWTRLWQWEIQPVSRVYAYKLNPTTSRLHAGYWACHFITSTSKIPLSTKSCIIHCYFYPMVDK